MLALYAIVRIVVINLVLSGDNAVVIGMAAHRLPSKQRRIAILIGGGVAVVLRIILTAIAALLLQITGLQFVGGILLIWIAFKLLKEEEESKEGVRIAASMREAVITILVADLIMSTDNVLGVAAASGGDLRLLVFRLIMSMAIIMWLGRWLSYVGAAVIAWTGAMMMFEDRFLTERAEWLSRSIAYVSAAVITIGVTAFAHWFHRVRGTREG